MKDAKKTGKKALNIAIYMLLGTWIALLALLAGIYILRLQGYKSFQEWKNRGQTQENNPPSIITPVPTKVQEKEEDAGHNSVVPTVVPTGEAAMQTPVPTPTTVSSPVSVVTPENEVELSVADLDKTRFSGQEVIDASIRSQAAAFAQGVQNLSCETHVVENYYSVVFRKTDIFDGEEVPYLLPLVYDLSGEEQVTGSDLIKESYFAVVKERLQTIVAEQFPEEAEASFVSYEEPYKTEDYQQFYMTNESIVFYFGEDSLIENRHQPFTYTASLDEAKAFFYYNLDGTTNGIAIRKLDPEKPMIAITYDDGPAYQYDLDRKLMDLFERYNGKLTFFFVGDRLSGNYQDVATEAYQRGHEVASHTYSHTNMEKASPEVIWPEINKTNLRIAELTGHAPDYVRLPGGSSKSYLSSLPLPIMKWNIDTIDWRDRDKDIIFERVKKTAKSGGIMLIHSIHLTSYEASELVVPWLVEQGYQLVTLSELFYYKGVTPENGVEYRGFDK